MGAPNLSKSRVLSALRCPKELYLYVQDKVREKGDKPKLAKFDAQAQQAFNWGNEVGQLARDLFPGGKLIKHDKELHLAVRETQTLLEDSLAVPLFEATFQHDGLLVRADVFIKGSDGSRLVEVKASSAVKKHHKHHLDDCAIQAWVIEKAGYPLDRIELARVDTSFVYQGDGNYDGLIKYEDVTGAVRERLPRVPEWIEKARKALADGEPKEPMGPRCNQPYPCGFLDYCTPNTTYPITALPGGGKKYALLEKGTRDICDIPEGCLTNSLQERVRRLTKAGETELDPGAAEQLRNRSYPRYYLDFETISFVIPEWPGTRPYQPLPFQWSCHVEKENGELLHDEFLDTSGEPPMRALARRLLVTLGDSGSIFIYTTYEKTVIEGLAKMFPDLADDLADLIARLVDLHLVTRDHYYDPAMRGSWSLKAVLPTVAPDLDYSELGEVQDGVAAGRAYLECIALDTDVVRRIELRMKLREYCKRDTLGMVKIARHLINGQS